MVALMGGLSHIATVSLSGFTMSDDLDEKYHHLALDALNRGLAGYEIVDQRNTVDVNVEEVLRAFEYSRDVLQSNQESEHIRDVADTVFRTCIRLARCLFFPEEARLIVLDGKEYQLNAGSQLDVLRRNVNDLQRFLRNG